MRLIRGSEEIVEPSTYRVHPVSDVTAAEIQPDPRRLFLVLTGIRSLNGAPWTLLLERQPGYWISRRDVNGLMDPERAVSGFLFNREGYQDPLDILRRMNEVGRQEYYHVLQEKMKGDRTRKELVEELTRLKDERDELRSLLRRRSVRRAETGRRSSDSRRKTSPSRRGRRRAPRPS